MKRAPAILLWTAFAVLIAGAGVVLLRACGLGLALGWNFCPTTPVTISSEAERQAGLVRLIAQLQLELTQRTLACASIPPPPPPPLDLPQEAGPPKPQQTAELKPPPPPPPPPPPKPQPALPADRWDKKDLSMLQGCWQLGREGQTRWAGKECIVRAGRMCFDASGHGQRETTIDCPGAGRIRCVAPVTARFGGDGTLGSTQPEVQCQPPPNRWFGPQNTLSCQRRTDNLATCRDQVGFDHEFRRMSQ